MCRRQGVRESLGMKLHNSVSSCERSVPPVCLYIYIYRTLVIFGPVEAPVLCKNVSRLIESSKVTYSTDINTQL